GYGKAEAHIGARKYTVEIRSLNGKGLDLSVRMPARFRPHEMDLRKQVGQAVGRGKSDLLINFESDASDVRHEVNTGLVQQYVDQLTPLFEANGVPASHVEGRLQQFQSALRFPDVVSATKDTLEEGEWEALRDLVSAASEQFIAYRTREGAVLEADFRQRVGTIEALRGELKPLLEARSERTRSRLWEHLEADLPRDRVDENRFEHELIFYMEKLDVTEELVRLEANCAYFLEMLDADSGQGKKLGFIAQEIGREINTLGSKCQDAGMQRLVVQMKDELEKIKEQVLNAL
ncbi:MAG: YicC/YloC family endoribonuclease, partial [Bacteroidota bacterium]|nr:YicC/YloC family endoribonuclease [Bacteroidota bacterium]